MLTVFLGGTANIYNLDRTAHVGGVEIQGPIDRAVTSQAIELIRSIRPDVDRDACGKLDVQQQGRPAANTGFNCVRPDLEMSTAASSGNLGKSHSMSRR
jgi:hypothetical protein